MWIFGALFGLVLGGIVGGIAGAITGVVLGAVGGMLMANSDGDQKSAATGSDLDSKLAHIYKSLADIHWRLEKIEKAQVLGASPMQRGADAGVVSETEHARAATTEAARAIPPLAPAAAMPDLAKIADELEQQTARPPMAKPATAPLSQKEIIAESVAALEKLVGGLTPSPPLATTEAPPVVAAKVTTAPAPAPRATPPRPPTPPVPSIPEVEPEPNFIERLFTGNIIAKLGVLLLFIGVGFGLKLAYEHGMFPVWLRLLMVAAGAGAMLVIGKRLLEKNRLYALILMGGGMGLLYVDTFFALKNFALISPAVGFALFFLLGIAMIWMAVKLDAKVMAVIGITGAFMSPILASTGTGSHVLLFSYYLMLNLVIFGVSWFKSWRSLNLTGFIFTFAIALFWGSSHYQPAFFSTVEPFLIAFFALYVAIPILFAHRQPPELRGFVDGTLIFGTPLSAAMMQSALTRGMGDHILAWSAAGVALVYAALAFSLWKRQSMRVLAEAHLALAIVFGTVAPYFAFDATPTFAFWALEGAAIVWLGCRQDRLLARCFGLFVAIGAAFYFWWHISGTPSNPWFNSVTVGCALIAASAWFTAWLLRRFANVLRAWEQPVEAAMTAWGCAWWLAGGLYAISHDAEFGGLMSAAAAMKILVFASASFLAWEMAGARLQWPNLRRANLAHLPVMVGSTLLAAMAHTQFLSQGLTHPLAGLGAFAWPLTFAIYFFVLHCQRRDEVIRGTIRYGLGWAVMLIIVSWEAGWRYQQHQFAWVGVIALAGFVAAILRYQLREREPLANGALATPVSSWVLAWSGAVWFAAAHGYCHLHFASADRMLAMLGFATFTAAALGVTGTLLRWVQMQRATLVLPVAMVVSALWLWAHHSHPAAGWGALVWPVALGVWLYVLWRQERDGVALWADAQALIAFWLATLLIAWELHWQCVHRDLSWAWQYAAIGAVIAAAFGTVVAAIRSARWPVAGREALFKQLAVVPLLFAAALWTLAANTSADGNAAPLPYLPLLNPLDLAQLALFAAAYFAIRDLDAPKAAPVLWMLMAGAAFLWMNGVLLRTMHHWAGVPFEFSALLNSVAVQAAISLLWTSTALVMMVAAGKRTSRKLWIAGFVLILIVVAKLLINDMQNSNSVARVVAVIGVSVLLLLTDYLAPYPRKAAKVAT